MPILFRQNRNMFKKSMRTYWSGKSKIIVPRFNKEYEYRYLSAHCGKLPLSRVEPYKEQFSKCLESFDKPGTKSRRRLFKFKKPPPMKEKPTNCHETETETKKIESSYWKHMFRTESKKSSLPCMSPMQYQEQIILRQQDPRLSDPCYQLTPGDVLIYTKIINAKRSEYHEPQPRFTPPYKVSRAALSKMVVADIEKINILCQCIALSQNDDSCTSNILKKNSIPFEEMRPSKKKKKAFTCRDGVSTEDIIYPSNTANNFYIKNTNSHSSVN